MWTVGRCVPTSVGDDPHVGLDDLHVDAVLLLPNDDRPPQADVLPLLLGAVCGDEIIGLAGASPAGRAGLWQQTNNNAGFRTGSRVFDQYQIGKCVSEGRSHTGTHLPSPSHGQCSRGSPLRPACPARRR